jgi:ABC-type multidrug transport system fused ATPase/permease subunit
LQTPGSEPHPLRVIKGIGSPGAQWATEAARPASLWVALSELWILVQQPYRRLLSISLVLIAINRVTGLVLPASTKFLIDRVIAKHSTRLLLPLISAVVVATAIQGITSFVLTQSLSKAAQRLIAELRTKIRAHISRLPVTYYDANNTGALVTRVMSDVEGIRTILGTGFVEFVGGLLTSVLALLVLLHISVILTAIALPLLAGLAFALWKSFEILRPIFRDRSLISAAVTGRLAESLAGIRVVKAYQAESREDAVFANGIQRLLDNALRTLTINGVMGLVSSLALGLVGALIMFVGAWQILAGSLTVGGLFTYILFLGFLVVPLAQIAGVGTQLGEAVAGLERTQELLLEPTEEGNPTRRFSLPSIDGEIVFDDVSFTYPSGEKVLSGISFSARPGTVTALVGSSGSGKSTVIGLVAAFYQPREGRVMVDGIDLSTVRLDSYRCQLGVVLQDSFLFDGTIRENVAFSRPDASEAAVQKACETAHVKEFAERLTGGYDTIVGERGVRLSGGQRQRISIARAVLADPRILVLDEATSSLDSESESLIQKGLGQLMHGRTTLVIAHRLSTIRRADQILVIEGGRIVERGNHSTLHAAHGRYYQLYERQHRFDSNLFVSDDELPSKDENASASDSMNNEVAIR